MANKMHAGLDEAPRILQAGLFLLAYLLKGIFLFFTRQTIIVMSRRIEYDLKGTIFDQYQRLDATFYKAQDTGDLMNRISEDVSKVRMYLGPAIMYTLNLTMLIPFGGECDGVHRLETDALRPAAAAADVRGHLLCEFAPTGRQSGATATKV